MRKHAVAELVNQNGYPVFVSKEVSGLQKQLRVSHISISRSCRSRGLSQANSSGLWLWVNFGIRYLSVPKLLHGEHTLSQDVDEGRQCSLHLAVDALCSCTLCQLW